MTADYRLLIDGQWLEPANRIEVKNKYSGEILADCPLRRAGGRGRGDRGRANGQLPSWLTCRPTSVRRYLRSYCRPAARTP